MCAIAQGSSRSIRVHWAMAAIFTAGMLVAIPAVDPAGAHSGFVTSEANLIDLGERVRALELERDRLDGELEAMRQLVWPTIWHYRNVDGRAERSERYLAPATFVLSGSMRGTAKAQPLDPAILLDLCADTDGCVVRMGLEGLVLADEDVEAVFLGAPCGLDLDRKTGDWALAADCPGASAGDAGADGWIWGRDGDDEPLGQGITEGRVILSFGNACFLAEARPRGGLGPADAGLQRDTNQDLFLITAGPGWDPRWPFPEHLLPTGPGESPFSCHLTIRD